MDPEQVLLMKKKFLRQGLTKFENKEEEYFRMVLLSFQLTHKENSKVLTLDYRSLFKRVTAEKLPFFKWHDWLQEMVEKL